MRDAVKRACGAAIAAAAVAAVLALPAAASHSWASYHWARTANPFTVSVVDSVSAIWDAPLVTARDDWSLSSVLDVATEPGSWTSKERRRCRAVSGKVRACNYAYGFNGWLGVAQIWVYGSHISQGTVKLNDSYFNTSTYNKLEWRRLVMCQEIGHTFGLDHQDENFSNPNLGTCMDYTNKPLGPPSNEHPNAHDYEQLETIYAHLDGLATAASSPTGKGKGRGKAERIKKSLYVKDLGKGQRKFTWVIWLDPDAPHPEPPVDDDE